MLRSLRDLGMTSLGARLGWLSTWSFLSGLAQAGALILLSDVAVGSAQHKGHITVVSISMSTDTALAIAFGCVALYFVSGSMAALASASMSSYAVRSGRDTIITRFFGASWSVQSGERLGQVQQLLTVNAERLGLIMLSLALGLQALLNLVALLLAAFVVSAIAAVTVLLVGVVLFAALRPFNTKTRRVANQWSRDNQDLAIMATEYTRLAREFRLLGVADQATRHLHQANAKAARSVMRTRRLTQMLPVVYSAVALAFVLAGLGLFVHSSGSNLASVAAVLLLVLRSLTYGAQVQSTGQQFSEFGAFIEQLEAQLEAYGIDAEEERSVTAPPRFDVRCDHVSFSYDSKVPVLHDISFSVDDGKIIGIVGRSGSGKSTLAQLLLGMRRPDQGEVLLGGARPSELIMAGGASPLALVAQDPVLLQGSIESNVAFFRSVSTAQIEAACRAAHLHDDIEAMSDGYATDVGPGGTSLSGGQRQRLAIARALVGNPRLLVLDEPTSALDGRSELLIRRTLDELRGKMTVVIISHRLATVDICELLLVLEHGCLADFGKGPMVRSGAAFQRVMQSVGMDLASRSDAEDPVEPLA